MAAPIPLTAPNRPQVRLSAGHSTLGLTVNRAPLEARQAGYGNRVTGVGQPRARGNDPPLGISPPTISICRLGWPLVQSAL